MHSPCPTTCDVAQTINLIGGKWKSVILFYLFQDTQRFGQLHRLLAGITQRTLTLQLRELEADGIIQRTVYQQVPPRVEYSLTPLGRSLQPIISSMQQWGADYKTHMAAIAQN